MLGIILDMQRIDHAQQGHDRKDIGEEQAELVDPSKLQLNPEKADLAKAAGGHLQTEIDRSGGYGNHCGALDRALEQGQ